MGPTSYTHIRTLYDVNDELIDRKQKFSATFARKGLSLKSKEEPYFPPHPRIKFGGWDSGNDTFVNIRASPVELTTAHDLPAFVGKRQPF